MVVITAGLALPIDKQGITGNFLCLLFRFGGLNGDLVMTANGAIAGIVGRADGEADKVIADAVSLAVLGFDPACLAMIVVI